MSPICRAAGAFALIGSLAFTGCQSRKETRTAVWLSRPEVARPESPPAESMAADVYVDATLSMTGYVADPDSAYVHLLDELEGSLANKWKNSADLRYYKFGRSVREVQREEFRGARKTAFYTERGIYESTDIDLVASRANQKRLTVVVTDLFQADQDINPIVTSIRRNVFQKDLAAGILAVSSEFDGKVYDAHVPAYRYASTKNASATYRPFYLLMFGNAAGIEQLVATLSERPFIDRTRFLLISPHVVRRYQVAAVKRRESKSLKARAGSEPDEFQFDVRPDGRGGVIDTEIHVDRNPDAADFKATGVDILARAVGAKPEETHDVTLQSVTRTGDVVKAVLLLDIGAPKGKYSYEILFRTGGPGAWQLPPWVDALSTDNPSPDKDSNKTMNLKRLVSELIDAGASIHRPALAKLRLNVRKLG